MAEYCTSLGKIREYGSLAAMEKRSQTLFEFMSMTTNFANNFLREGVE